MTEKLEDLTPEKIAEIAKSGRPLPAILEKYKDEIQLKKVRIQKMLKLYDLAVKLAPDSIPDDMKKETERMQIVLEGIETIEQLEMLSD